MATTSQDLETLRQFSELKRDAKQLRQNHLQSVKEKNMHHTKTSSELMQIMKHNRIDCWQVDTETYVQLKNSYQSKPITPALIKESIQQKFSSTLEVIPDEIQNIKNVICGYINNMRRVKKLSLTIIKKKPKHLEMIPLAPSTVCSKIHDMQAQKERMAVANVHYREQMKSIKKTEEVVTENVENILSKLNQTRVVGETGTIIRKKITTKGTILLPQLEQALQNSLEKNINSEIVIDDFIKDVMREIDNLRVLKSKEIIVLQEPKRSTI